ncbi:MAG TPA: hypothetical protein VLA56_10650, partial [Pseudomonadales bacterium]|nr:hypothetical protein [Pseudomonadales bacterium]
LRLAVVLAPLGVEALPELAAGDGELRIAPNAAWRQAHPWVMERLRDECAQLASAGTWPRPILGDRVET